jgi:predicted DNA-binding protein (UPF0251 family)
MPRPVQCRRVCLSPACAYFKPAGIPIRNLHEQIISLDELEALRLADVEGIYHEQAADRMGVSRRTFGRIIESARKKVAVALIHGMALRIEGGVVHRADQRTFECGDCAHVWQVPFGTGRPAECPQCHGKNFQRAEEERGQGGRRRRGNRATGAVAGAVAEADSGASVPASTTSAVRGRVRQRRGRRRGTSA